MRRWGFAEGDEIAPDRQAVRLLGGHRYEPWLAWDERLRAPVVAKLLDDLTRGDDGTAGDANTGDGDRSRGDDGSRGGVTRGNDGTRAADNMGDRASTRGNDGSRRGDNCGPPADRRPR